uniref:Stabilin 1 n=1 Tax=Paramormyrops kingsleyae TaxID=1676925 RepID=A0A3B3QXX6_9TELE|nr:stabilin-1-like isoform X2 [Paramormyrops kingsleyae]
MTVSCPWAARGPGLPLTHGTPFDLPVMSLRAPALVGLWASAASRSEINMRLLLLLILGLVMSFSEELEDPNPPNRCDEHRAISAVTPCTSCAASPAMTCPRGFRNTSGDIGDRGCSYTVSIGGRLRVLPGCRHTCEKRVSELRCCPNFWGPLCLPCPSWSGEACNGHGSCMDGAAGNGTCVCDEGFSGLACQDCQKSSAYGEHCDSECSCVHGQCNKGPRGNGECYCQPPYTGSRCDTVTESCSNCPTNSYCKGNGSNAVCECLPGFKTNGSICAGICVRDTCAENADCTYLGGRGPQCKCKVGYEGDGKVCLPVNPCSVDHGDCPANSTTCVYVSPGKSRCACKGTMGGSSPSEGCAPRSACTDMTCDRGARCETGPDELPSCTCGAHQVGDGRRCFGSIMERVLELDRSGRQNGEITGSVTLFEKGCQITLSKHGPFTAFVPLLRAAPTGVSESSFCRHHLILGQHLLRDLQGNNFWTFGGDAVRFKEDKQFCLIRDPDILYSIIQSDIPASNGIIHIIDTPITNTHSDVTSVHKQLANETVGEIIAQDPRFSRFRSLLDSCSLPVSLRSAGPLTVFAPTNEALDLFQDGTVTYMITHAQHKLQELLKHHIFSAAASVALDQLASMSELETMANQIIRVNVTNDGRMLLGDKEVILGSSSIIASNGIVHLINGVLVPPSIEPILPKRCDVTESIITTGPCVRCDQLSETHCPSGTTELRSHMVDCEYQASSSSSALSVGGCAKYCNLTRMRAECCKGFYGPDCKPCSGGFQEPCYGKGTCLDGITGNGTCSCKPGFKGTACHICADEAKHGEECDEECRCVHGVCDNRPGSTGICRKGSCQQGFSGEFCDKTVKPCDSDGTFQICYIHADCDFSGLHPMCVCRAGYEGDGRSCTPINLCLSASRGGCDKNAQCIYAGPANVSCVCNQGWTGDGTYCVEVNNCLLESHGGCHGNASCIFVGPGEHECICNRGYQGDGISCDIINPCLIDNGGCHMLASCELREGGTYMCVCPAGYSGDGTMCYGSILIELDANSDFYQFNDFIKKSSPLNLKGNVTALVPSKDAFNNLNDNEMKFWNDPYRLPYLLKVHFLEGAFSYEDLKKHVNKDLATLNPQTKWGIKDQNGEVMVQNATIIIPDIPATNGYIHVIDKVLTPRLSDLPQAPPTLMELLNQTPAFSLFRQATLLYNLTDIIQSQKYTLFVPLDDAIRKHMSETNSTGLDEGAFKYHIIVSERLYPDDLRNGTVKSTLLGPAHQIMFHTNHQNEIFANEVALDGNFTVTKNGAVFGISQLFEIHKNRCIKDAMIKIRGKCGSCEMSPRCPRNSIPVTLAFPSNMEPNCNYGKQVKSVSGCMTDCFRKEKDHSCCPGYFGHGCFKCPGKLGNWCSGNGRCQDGTFGSGDCLCNEGFHGTACETCDPGRYGKDCKSVCNCGNGKCTDGLDGDGRCLCYKGWKGVNCSVEIASDACGGVCDDNANCITDGPTFPPTCSCMAGYQGNGTSCQEIDPCVESNGGCSAHASCVKTLPGERTCSCLDGYKGDGVVCLEIDGCLENNGGCHTNADCLKTGPNQVACNCMTGYSGDGHQCEPINECKMNNGGCSPNAGCTYTGPGERACACQRGFVGDGLTCRGSLIYEVRRHPQASWLNKRLEDMRIGDLKQKGPFTLFVPHVDYIQNFTVEPWINSSNLDDLLRYHMIGCKQLLQSDLQSASEVVTLSGYRLRISVREGSLYINEDTKIVNSDYITTTGVLHFIDKVLTPYDIGNKSRGLPETLNVTAAAEAYGYTVFGRLLQEADLTAMVQNSWHHPFTMLWPRDAAFSALPEERRRWLFSEEHHDKLVATVKAHIIRGAKLPAASLPMKGSLRTIFGSTISFSCDRRTVGDILVDDGNARVIERHLDFNVGIAHGIDQLLEPPGLGARCDTFKEKKINGLCWMCWTRPRCPFGYRFTGETKPCSIDRISMKRRPSHEDFFRAWRCQPVCVKVQWVPQCCQNHYGRDCQVCPGGLEAPCSNHGVCSDRMQGQGTCVCHAGFTGTACERCRPNYHGANCTQCMCSPNGTCEDGMEGDGSCFCQEGWTGARCEAKLETEPLCSPPCHANAVCQDGNTCECDPSYEGDGWNCTAPDLCGDDNGGCHEHASCSQTGVNVTCLCEAGYTGDGYACSPINRCMEEPNGGCSDFATCLYAGPKKRVCQCHPGYVGDGIQCLQKVVPPVSRCLEDNGGCDPKADCKDLHFHGNTAGVFHLRSPLGAYKLNYTEAQAACRAEQASLATFSQLSDAQQLGMHLCVAGWIEGQQAGYPTRFPSPKCGNNHVGVVMYKSPVALNSTYDAYCYRIQDVTCDCGPGYIGDGLFCHGHLASVVATNDNFSVFYSILLNYANSSPAAAALLNLLSSHSTNITLFIPQNAGFHVNQTLSWRDLEYHISANNGAHFYDDLEHGMLVPSQLGYNLSVAVSSPNRTLDSAAQLPEKHVNDRLIVDWDIPATNGIIHVLEGPLKAPPPPVLPAESPSNAMSHSHAGTVINAVLAAAVLAAFGGLVYYLYKRKNTGFHFRHFQNEEDQGGPSSTEAKPTLVSIPNPLYSGSMAFAEPFGDFPNADSSDIQHMCN